MRLALAGLSQSGKTRVFGALAGRNVDEIEHSREAVLASVKVPDERLDFVHSKFPTAKKTEASFELVDLGPAPGREQAKSGPSEGELLGQLRQADAHLVALRAFDSNVSGPALGNVDPLAEWEELSATFLVADAAQIERKLAKIGKKRGVKTGSPEAREIEVLRRLLAHLEEMKPMSGFPFTAEEERMLASYHFLSKKKRLFLLNVNETALDAVHPAEERLAAIGPVMKISAQMELELAELPPEDREVFMEEMKVQSLMKERVIKECYRFLGYVSFFTMGDKDVRAWRIPEGATAVEAAGAIHTDFQRGFIKAEVMSYSDFVETPSQKELRAKGLARLEGKDYVVQDGDIIEFRFNV